MKLEFCLFALFLLLSCGSETTSDSTPGVPTTKTLQKSATAATNHPQPLVAFPFDLELVDADGNKQNSKKIFKKNGKPTVLMFWLTTCRPCHMKLNAIKPIYPNWKESADFNIYAISGDWPKNYENFVKQTKSKKWEWKTYHDTNRAFKDILPGGLNGYPQTFIFDKDGKLVYQDKRYSPEDEKKLFKKIQEICNS